MVEVRWIAIYMRGAVCVLVLALGRAKSGWWLAYKKRKRSLMEEGAQDTKVRQVRPMMEKETGEKWKER